MCTWTGREAEHRMDGVYAGSMVDLRAYRPDFSSPSFTWTTPPCGSAHPSCPRHSNPEGVLSLQMMDPVRAGNDSIHVSTSSTPLFTSPLSFPIARRPDPSRAQVVIHPTPADFSNGQIYDLGQNIAGLLLHHRPHHSRRGASSSNMRHAELSYTTGANGMPYSGPQQ